MLKITKRELVMPTVQSDGKNPKHTHRKQSFAFVNIEALEANRWIDDVKAEEAVVQKEKYAWQKLCETIHVPDHFDVSNEESQKMNEVGNSSISTDTQP